MTDNQFVQLSGDLDFIEEHDEHGDIAAGNTFVDASLLDEFSDPAGDAGVAEAETKASEAVKKSVISKQLVAVKDRLIAEITQFEKPLCYLRGDFYDRPWHPVFAVQDDMKHKGLDPERLYQRDVFVWLPHLLPGAPSKFRCACGMHLSRNGMS